LKDLGLDGRILKWIFKKWGERSRPDVIWLGIRTGDWIL
jgi:hypothetical protein